MAANNKIKTDLMGTYDANDTYFSADGKTAYGYGTTNLFTFSYDNDLESVQEDAQGTGVPSIINKTSATFNVTLNQMSPFNAVLDGLANERRKGGFTVDACDGSRHYVAIHCYIKKKPDGGAGNEAGERTWTINAINVVENSVLNN
ncbi:hypothetical protein [Lactobacillus helveticus]|uniref:hypothetical protein n=1 Tax=Lactobacillus helveticus TaxID=1587 RepID=UPI00062AA265|nr:hypothetical protein [Lactobacillus helveticus]AKG66649.1 hypothetical protein TU99_04850 [Lactobacillus helveticus]